MNVDSKKNIIRKIKNNDSKALRELFDLYATALTFFAYRFVYDKSEAENIVQDVFIGVWKNINNMDDNINIKAYLYKSVKNRAINLLNQNKESTEFEENLFLYKSFSQQTTIETNELYENYKKAIEELPTSCRNIFLMSREDNLTYKEIAEILNISIKTVETQMGRALKSIRKKIEKYLLTFVGVILSFFV